MGVAVCEHAAVERVQKVPPHLLPMSPAMQQLRPALESHCWFRLQSVHNLLHAAGAAAAGERAGCGMRGVPVVHPGGARLLGRGNWATNWCTCLVSCNNSTSHALLHRLLFA